MVFYYSEDYLKKFVPKCFQCAKPIIDSQTSALGHQWHPACFACAVSKKFLKSFFSNCEMIASVQTDFYAIVSYRNV